MLLSSSTMSTCGIASWERSAPREPDDPENAALNAAFRCREDGSPGFFRVVTELERTRGVLVGLCDPANARRPSHGGTGDGGTDG